MCTACIGTYGGACVYFADLVIFCYVQVCGCTVAYVCCVVFLFIRVNFLCVCCLSAYVCVCVLLLFPRSCLVAIMTIFGNLVLPGGCVIAFCGFCFFAAAFYLPAKVFLGAFFF